MEFWLKENEKNLYRFPVNPSNYTMTNGSTITTLTLNEVGEIALFSGNKLYGLTLSSMFPAKIYSFCNYSNFPNPEKSIEIFEKWQKSGTVLRLIITSTKINMPVIIEQFRYGERDGTRDIYFEVMLREYKYLKAKTSKVSGKTLIREAPKVTSKSYTVVSGDTLWGIAARFYGNGSLYTKIYEANKSLIKNPNLIYPGWKLVIPQ